jgi:hypothetical protein
MPMNTHESTTQPDEQPPRYSDSTFHITSEVAKSEIGVFSTQKINSVRVVSRLLVVPNENSTLGDLAAEIFIVSSLVGIIYLGTGFQFALLKR